MGKYTLVDGDIDLIIQEQLDSIIIFLKRCFEGIESIVLVGGFGRGEGVVRVEPDKTEVLSDYDLYIILSNQNKLSMQQVENLIGKSLHNKAGDPKISSSNQTSLDLHFLNRDMLEKLQLTLRFFDLKYGSKVLYGKDLLHLIPDFNPNKIPRYEGTRLLINRLYYTADWFSLRHILDMKSANAIKHLLLREASKNYLISCYALSILTSLYEPSALKCADKLEENYTRLYPSLAKLRPDLARTIGSFIRRALESKLDGDSPSDIWMQSLTDLFTVTEFYHKESVGIENWDNFYRKTSKDHLKPYLHSMVQRKIRINLPPIALTVMSVVAQITQRINWFMKILKDKERIYWPILSDYRDPAISIYSSLLFLFLSINRDGALNKDLFRCARNYLQTIYPKQPIHDITNDVDAFSKTAEDCINAYDLNFGKGPTIDGERFRVILRVIG